MPSAGTRAIAHKTGSILFEKDKRPYNALVSMDTGVVRKECDTIGERPMRERKGNIESFSKVFEIGIINTLRLNFHYFGWGGYFIPEYLRQDN